MLSMWHSRRICNHRCTKSDVLTRKKDVAIDSKEQASSWPENWELLSTEMEPNALPAA